MPVALAIDPFTETRTGSSAGTPYMIFVAASTARALVPSERLQGKRISALVALDEILRTCAHEDWNGEGARSVSIASANVAHNLILNLPLEAPTPEIGIDPDGSITLEWYVDATRRMSVSITSGAFADYAGIYGLSEFWGREPVRDRLPDSIRGRLADILGK